MTPDETSAETRAAQPSRRPLRRVFSDAEKRVIALESDRPGVSVSSVARKHGIVTGSWSGGGCSSARADHAPVVVALQALVQPPDGRAAVELPDGRRVFAPAGAYPDTVQTQIDRVTSVKPV